MHKIEFHEGLFACDRLDGKELVAGEQLHVLFPDGTDQFLDVIILTEHFSHTSGLKLELSRHRAFFNASVHGTHKWITAVGLTAERMHQ